MDYNGQERSGQTRYTIFLLKGDTHPVRHFPAGSPPRSGHPEVPALRLAQEPIPELNACTTTTKGCLSSAW